MFRPIRFSGAGVLNDPLNVTRGEKWAISQFGMNRSVAAR